MENDGKAAKEKKAKARAVGGLDHWCPPIVRFQRAFTTVFEFEEGGARRESRARREGGGRAKKEAGNSAIANCKESS